MTTVEALRARSRSFGVSGIAGAVLFGWWMGTLALASTFASYAEAACTTPPFLLLALAIGLLGDERPPHARRVVVRVLSGIAVVIGLAASLSRSLGGLAAHAPPGTAALVAGTFVLLGAAIVVHDLDAGPFPARIRDGLVAIPLLLSIALFVSMIEADPRSAPLGMRTALASTSVGLGLACLAILSARPTRGLVRFVANDGTTGRFLRRALPAAIGVPIGIGALRAIAERTGWAHGSSATETLAEALCLSAVVAWNAHALWQAAEGGRRAVERLRQSEEDLRVTLDSIGYGVVVTDAASRIVRVTAAAERCSGYASRDLIGKRFDDLFCAVDRDTRAPVESPFDHVAREGSAEGLAGRALLVAPDGSERAVLQSGAPILSRLGILRGVVLVLGESGRSITRR